jgi:DNA-binding CsgD family transcriptional regulator
MALVEREPELAELGSAIARARDGKGTTVVVHGPAGIGKTALLAEAGRRARAAGLTVLDTTGRELEREYPLGVVRQLIERATAGRGAAGGRAALAGAGALGDLLDAPPTAAPPADAPFVIAQAFYWLVADLAERGPLLIVVDDVHWADAGSLRALAYLTARIDELAVVVAVAQRDGQHVEELIAAATAAVTVRPHALTPEGTARVVRDNGMAAADSAFCQACHRATDGNPFLVRELVLAAQREGIGGDAAGARRIESLSPRTVSRAVLERIRHLGPHARELAVALAVLERAHVRDAAALAGIDEEDATRAADALVDAGVVAAELPLRFAHPILRSAVAADQAPPSRAARHRRAARILRDRGAPPEAVASHLLAAEPTDEAWALEALAAAGRSAFARGSPDDAVKLMRRALAGRTADADLLLQLGQAELASGDPVAVTRLEAAVAAAGDPATRGTALAMLGRARYLTGDLRGAVATTSRALDELAARPPDLLAAQVLHAYALAARPVPSCVADLRVRLARPPPRPPTGPSAPEAARLALVALDGHLRGRPRDDVVESARRAADERARLGREADELGPVPIEALVLAWSDASAEALPIWQRYFDRARRRGSAFDHAIVCEGRASARWLAGLVPQTLADTETVLAMASRGFEVHSIPTRVARSESLLERGDLEGAAAALDVGEELVARLPDTWGAIWLPFGRSRLRLEQGDARQALDDALLAGQAALAIDAPSPAYCWWRSRAALAAARLGDLGTARKLCEEELGLARACGVPRAIGVSLRATALIDVAAGAEEQAVPTLHEASAVLARSDARLERARCLAELGTTLRRLRRPREAREPLREAVDLARRCGATALEARAHDQLLAAGARPRRAAHRGLEALTAREVRVAELAAEGLGNRQIAQALFISRKTVEAHLRSIFRKLSVRSREELASRLDVPSGRVPDATAPLDTARMRRGDKGGVDPDSGGS